MRCDAPVCDALLRVAGRREAVRMHLRLHRAIRVIERGGIERKLRRKTKEVEVAIVQRGHRIEVSVHSKERMQSAVPRCDRGIMRSCEAN
jgi:hypothetical protein